MLVGEYGGGYEHGNLFAVGGGLKGSADGNLCLAEAYVAADEAVHRALALHVTLHVVGGFQLVGGILIYEACLELVLQIAVGRESKTLLLVAL